MPLLGRELKPAHRLGIVLLDAETFAYIYESDVELRVVVSSVDSPRVGEHQSEFERIRRLRLHRRTSHERDQNGDGGNERLHAALLCVTV